MLKLKDTVFYGTTGVCVVDCVEKKKIGNMKKDYYVLKPVSQSSSTVFIPTDNEKLLLKVKPVISSDDINGLIHAKESFEDVWVENEAERREVFSNIITSGDRLSQIKLVRSIHNKQRELNTQSKRLHIADERFFKEVLRLICDEFSFVLKISVKEIEELIYNAV